MKKKLSWLIQTIDLLQLRLNQIRANSVLTKLFSQNSTSESWLNPKTV